MVEAELNNSQEEVIRVARAEISRVEEIGQAEQRCNRSRRGQAEQPPHGQDRAEQQPGGSAHSSLVGGQAEQSIIVQKSLVKDGDRAEHVKNGRQAEHQDSPGAETGRAEQPWQVEGNDQYLKAWEEWKGWKDQQG